MSLLLLHDHNYRPNDNQSCITLPDAVSFRGKINLSKVVFLGHSFGGATAVTAAAYPDLISPLPLWLTNQLQIVCQTLDEKPYSWMKVEERAPTSLILEELEDSSLQL
jgi:hypothetical protein